MIWSCVRRDTQTFFGLRCIVGGKYFNVFVQVFRLAKAGASKKDRRDRELGHE
jgi:hypothetical protein